MRIPHHIDRTKRTQTSAQGTGVLMKLVKYLGAALLAALTVACGRPEPRVAVSTEFTPEESAAIAKAAAKWNTIVRTPVHVDGGPWQMIKAEPPDYKSKGFIGQTDYPGKHIWIMPGLAPELFYALVLHEFGHMLGLHHVQGAAVMNPTVKREQTEFTSADIEECQKVGACGYSPSEAAKLRLQGVIP